MRQPFDCIRIDLVGLLTITSRGNRYIAVVMDYLTKWPEAKTIQRANAESQNTTQATPFELVYDRTATLPVEIKVNTYSTKPIIEDNFQKTLLRRTYDLMEILENKWQKAADNIQKSQEKQKKRHNNQLPEKPVEFKIEDKVLLYCTKAEKQ
ncbi:hypothetical protein G9A89_010340 [Geosiphon pyriformis]|nr:hypothetical protein G9A89_010340 [Geosiphon pyriformis]